MSQTTTVFQIGQGLAVLENNDKIHIIDPLGRFIWESLANGMRLEQLTDVLAEEGGYDARAVQKLVSSWKEMGLVPTPIEKGPFEKGYQQHRYWLGDTRIALQINDIGLLHHLQACIGHLKNYETGPITDVFTLCHQETKYRLYKNHVLLHSFSSKNDCIVQTIWEMVEAACRLPSRLMIVHGSAVADGNACCILAGAGGSGKTTLAAGLVATGSLLVADDVVPIDEPSGLAVPIPMSMCLKEGSWKSLLAYYPHYKTYPQFLRYNKNVRFFPPPIHALPKRTERFHINTIIFPHFNHIAERTLVALAPHEVLAKLIQTNSIINTWTAEKIEKVIAWLSTMKGYAITYPDLQTGMGLVKELMGHNKNLISLP